MTAAFATIAIATMIAAARGEPFGVRLAPDGRPEYLMDFAAIRAFTRAAWSGVLARESTSIYTPAAYQRATELWLGRPVDVAQPSGYSPTMLWVMAPFCALPGRLAFFAWSIAGILATAWMMLRARVSWPALLVFLMPLTVFAVALGQTALLGVPALFYLMTAEREEQGGWEVAGKLGAVLWLLTAKPPLAIVAGTALLARGRWRVLVVAVALTVVGTVVLTPWLGHAWIGDYITILGSYDRTRMPASSAWALAPGLMSNLRATLHVDLGITDGVATRMSASCWGIALAGLLVTARRGALSPGAVWSLSLLSSLIFCPHVTATEELALFLVPASLAAHGAGGALEGTATALVLAGVLLSPALGPARARRPPPAFFTKALLLVPVILTAKASDRGRAAADAV